jgi:hypothetical protein
MHCAHCAVIESYIEDIHEEFNGDTQAIGGWNGSGPWLIRNNYLEAAGENILIGGAQITVPNMNPSDIVIERNHLFKPYTWKVGHPTYAGVGWAVKNLLELKTCVRCLLEGNILENIWPANQEGAAMGFFAANSPGNCSDTWSAVQDITFRYNIVENAEGGVGGPSGDNGRCRVDTATGPVLIHDNLFKNITGNTQAQRFFFQGGNVIAGSTHDGCVDCAWIHNTFITTPFTTSPKWFMYEGIVPTGFTPMPRFAFHDNIVGSFSYGTNGNCRIGSTPVPCWDNVTYNAWHRNIAYGTRSGSCAFTDDFPYAKNAVACPVADINAVGFVDPVGGNFRLLPSSIGKNAATDGRDVGADINLLEAKIAGVR